MKQIFSLLIVVCYLTPAFSQTEISRETDGTKIIKGFISKKDLSSDKDFGWFAENQNGYTPNDAALKASTQNKDSVNYLVFGGTWCGDTKHILPKFLSLLDAAGVSQDRLTMLGVDRSKKTIQHLSEAFNITNVPTIIVLKNGREVGRVVEYGKSGMFDKDLAEILGGK